VSVEAGAAAVCQ